MMPMIAKLNANAPYDDQWLPSARHSPSRATMSAAGTRSSSTSSVIAMANTPSQNAPTRSVPWPAPSELNPQLPPHRVDACLGFRIHHDLVGPLAREAFLLPLPRGIDPHLGPVREAPARMVEHVSRSHRQPRVAFGVDVVQAHPPRFLRISHVDVFVHHHDHLGQRHQPLPPQAVHHFVRLTRVLFVDAHEHEVVA